MRTTIYCLLFGLVFISCGNKQEGQEASPESEKKGLFSSVFESNRKKRHEFKDARTGLVVHSCEYPANWKVISKPIYTIDQKLPNFLVQVEGPGNLKNFNTPFTFHFHFSNPQMNQYLSYPMNKLLKPLVSTRQIHQSEVEERMQKSGYRYIGTRDMPREEAYARKMIKEKGTGQEQLRTLNTEWVNDKGQKALVSVMQVSLQQAMSPNESMMVWFYGISYTFVDQDQYEDTVEKMYESTLSTEFNPQWDQYMAQLRQQRAEVNRQRAQQSAIAHRNRMQMRQASFDAHQQKMKGIWAAQDSNHASFMNRNFGTGSNVGQQQFVNMINEEETVFNPLSGKNYQVNAGSLQYWMDSDGNYIKNDDLFYTPNGDINLNNREWVQVGSAF
jgi:hypothetical protein